MEKKPVSNYKQGSVQEDSCHNSSVDEFSESIDVVWDWNSPQAKKRPKKQQKRLLPHSPKIPMKRHPSIQDFQKLRAELQSLRDEIAMPEHEETLVLSPLEEAEYKCLDINEVEFNSYMQEDIEAAETFDDLFNDSFDEQMVQFSQKVESDLLSETLKNKQVICEPTSVSAMNKSCEKIFKFTKTNKDNVTKLANDSFDELLGTIEVNSVTKCNKNSENNVIIGKVEFHRTKSFELSNLEHSKGIYATKLQEIERKRKEALAKLQIKKKPTLPTNSPIQCSLEEIEQKRRQALAKREAKRQQEIIEQKRQDALKRLEISRKKNATIVRSSLTTRMN